MEGAESTRPENEGRWWRSLNVKCKSWMSMKGTVDPKKPRELQG